MTSSTHDDSAETAPEHGAEAVAPKAPRRRKAAAVVPPEALDATAPAEASAPDAVTPAAGVPDAPAAADEPPARAPRAPRRKPVAQADADVAVPSDATVPVDLPARAVAEAATGEADAGGGVTAPTASHEAVSQDGTLPGEPGDGSDATSGTPGEERGRRRNRRDRKRGAQGDGSPGERHGAAHGADGEAARPPMPVVDAGAVFAEVLAGGYDAEPALPDELEPDAVVPDKRILAPDADAPKLHKVLAQAGVGSRRELEDMILDGRVSVNGEPAHVGQRISYGDRITIGGKPVKYRIAPPPARIIAYHKPVGEVVTHDDPQQRPTVFRRLPRLQQGKWQSVGRLDINTEGLLLFTNSGELANQLMHPRFGVEREYAVRVMGTLDESQRGRLLEGVILEGQTAGFRSIEDGGGEGANRWYRVVITEGRNREVRKLFEAVGLTVSRLIRIRYGTMVLPRGLRRGDWVDIEDADVRTIRRLVGLDAPRHDAGQQRGQGQGPGQQGKAGPQRGPGGGQGQNPNGPRQNGPGNGNFNSGGKHRGNPNQAGNGPGHHGNPNGPRGRDRDRPRPPGGDRPYPDAPAVLSRDDAPVGGYDDNDEDLDFDPSRIPNPLEQTFDRRFVEKGRGGGGGGFGGGGGGGPRGAARGKKPGGGTPAQPDPLQTAIGYIGADAFLRKGGNRGGGGGGFGGGGRRGR